MSSADAEFVDPQSMRAAGSDVPVVVVAAPGLGVIGGKAESDRELQSFGALVSSVRRQSERAAWLLNRLGECAVSLRNARGAAAAAHGEATAAALKAPLHVPAKAVEATIGAAGAGAGDGDGGLLDERAGNPPQQEQRQQQTHQNQDAAMDDASQGPACNAGPGPGAPAAATAATGRMDTAVMREHSEEEQSDLHVAELLLILVELRVIHRELRVDAHAANAALDPLKAEVEAGRLEFENLAYEREMLTREITLLQSRKADEFDSLGLSPRQSSIVEQAIVRCPSQAPWLNQAVQPAEGPFAQLDAVASDPLSTGLKSERATYSAPVSRDAPMTASASHCSVALEGNVEEYSELANSSNGKPHVQREDLTHREHVAMLQKLEHELEERRRLTKLVVDIRREHEILKSQNTTQAQFLLDLPARIKQVLQAVEPLNSFFDSKHDKSNKYSGQSLLGAKDEAGTLRDLPQPLYVLAREAIAFRDAFRGCIGVELLEQDTSAPAKPPFLAKPENPPIIQTRTEDLRHDPVDSYADSAMHEDEQPPSTDSVGGEGSRGLVPITEGRFFNAAVSSIPADRQIDTITSLHATHPKIVRIHLLDVTSCERDEGPNPVGQSSGGSWEGCRSSAENPSGNGLSSRSEPMISLTFRLHPKLGFVTVSASQSSTSSLVDTDDLCLLFPCDYGLKSPNPSNVHLLNGTFRFCRDLIPDSGRPYLWANLLCGLHFPGALQGSVDVRSHLPSEFQEWCNVAANYPTHLRFKDVVTFVRRRVHAVRSVRAQLASLSEMKLPMSWQQVGLSKPPVAKLTMFAPCPPDMDSTGLEIAAGSSETCTVPWAFHVVHPDGINLAGVLGIQPNYPVTPGVFRMKSMPDAGVLVAEADIRDMESEVSVFGDRFITEAKDKTSQDRGGRKQHVPELPSECDAIRSREDDANMILSRQILKLLACVDLVATAMSEHTAALSSGQPDDETNFGDGRMSPLDIHDEEGMAGKDGVGLAQVMENTMNSSGLGPTERPGRTAHGRARSKKFRF